MLTVLDIADRGYFVPYRYASRVAGAAPRGGYPAVEALLSARQDDFRDQLRRLDGFAADLAGIAEPAPPGSPKGPRWQQDWFPRLDAAIAYTLVRTLAPRRIVEIGSGHSTRFLARAVADGGLDCRITAIDPAPRAGLQHLGVTLLRQPLQETTAAPWAQLAAGDLLMVDSSHILMPGSDVDILLGRILPGLPAGVLVQFHDIFLPDDYPAAWHWRGYNEQLGVVPLLFGGCWQVLFASHYMVTRMAADVAGSAAARLPLPEGAVESSLWLCKRAA